MDMWNFIWGILFDFPFYSLLGMSFLISFRIINFPDVTIDASYALGMTLLVSMIRYDFSFPLLSVLIILPFFALLMGTLTGSLHCLPIFRVNKLLAGLVVSFAMFAVNFRLNGNTSTAGLFNKMHELNWLKGVLGNYGITQKVVPLLCMVLVVFIFIVLWFFLKSGIAICSRIAGYKPNILVEVGKKPIVYVIIGLAVSNGLAILAGASRAAVDNYADINTFGNFLYALASLLIGEKFVYLWYQEKSCSPFVQLLAPVVGGFLVALIMQVSVLLLITFSSVYLGCDIRLIVALVIVAVHFKTNSDSPGDTNAFSL